MRILMIQPNYHAGGAEIAGNWPPSWVPYVGGALKQAGFTNVRFVDAMSQNISDEVLAQIIETNQPDVVLATAITPMIYQVIIVESDEATRIRLRTELRQQAGIEIASEATNGETGLVL